MYPGFVSHIKWKVDFYKLDLFKSAFPKVKALEGRLLKRKC
jgi:hypothetical protein